MKKFKKKVFWAVAFLLDIGNVNVHRSVGGLQNILLLNMTIIM